MEIISGSGVIGTVPTFLNCLLERSLWTRRRRRRRWRWTGRREKKSLKQSLDILQNTLLEFQEGCGLVASYLERISNMAHFEEVPRYSSSTRMIN